MNQPLLAPNQGQPVQRNLGQLIANLGPQSSLVAQSTVDPRALAAGIKPSFATINFKGKTWGVRYRGVTQQLLVRGPQGEILGAVPTIDVIIVKSATAISKTFYIDKYKEGSNAPPDCWSTNGQVPDLAAAKKQSETCRGCRWDAFGSRTLDDGRKGKACSDNKRIAVVPATDIKNEGYGGPMLLKLPPSSFNGLSELENQLHLQGYAYFAVVMRLNFDHEQAFPKIIFTPIRVLNDHEQQEVIGLQGIDTVERILNEELIEVSGDPNQPVQGEPAPLQPQQPVTSVVTAPAQAGAGTAFDPGPMPAHLVRPVPAQPTMTAEQQRIAELEAQLKAATQPAPPPAPPPPPPPPVLTPDQQRIADLEAALAAAKAGQAPAAAQPDKPARAPRKRTQPVTPAATSTTGGTTPAPVIALGDQTGVIQPGQAPLPFGQTAAAAQQGPQAVPQAAQQAAQQAAPMANGEDTGDTPPDLDSRIDALLRPAGPTAT